MVYITSSKLMPFNRIMNSPTSRHISKFLHRDICSRVIRQKFLDYFIEEKGHYFIKSSPVVPYCDPTLPFVNSGMTQFKGIFLGNQEPQYPMVANSQKCIRVGGKHNDLSAVGMDGYHHTFFEMLGNWSFGEYFKDEACMMAWDLLTNVYKLPKYKLYVTYFGGDERLQIPEDLETKDIWRRLGVSPTRILPFGTQHNFWEMGLTGPCGPCTEIHIDHQGFSQRGKFVNKGLHDLTEIWNIVFIEYDRNQDGTITPLPQRHVDTGMGFERLTSVLQGKISSYDTDNFSYLLTAIHKISSLPKYRGRFGENDWNHLDSSYRIMADHTRMITACLADGMIPEQNQKLRRILRKAFLLSETVFHKERGLVRELTNYVVENLGFVYPEMEKNISQIHQIIDYEEEVYKTLRQSVKRDWQIITKETPKLLQLDIVESPSFIAAYRELCDTKPEAIDANLAFKLYDTYGLDEEVIGKLAKALGISFDPEEFVEGLEIAKRKSKLATVQLSSGTNLSEIFVNEDVPKTDDSLKYSYCKKSDEYEFAPVNVTVLKMFQEERLVDHVIPDYFSSLLLDKTNLYSEAGGQISDRGVIEFGSASFEVLELENVNGWILHKGFFKSTGHLLINGSKGTLHVDEDFRLNCMRGHTATHLLNAVVQTVKGASCQKSSSVKDKFLKFDVAVFGKKLNIDDVVRIEEEMQEVIKKGIPVEVTKVNSRMLLDYDKVTLIPGEIYPEEGIRIVEVQDGDFVSREPCCGTHVKHTSDIKDFVIAGLKSLGRSTTSIFALTGDRAEQARTNGVELVEQINALRTYIDDNLDKPDLLNTIVSSLKKRLTYTIDDDAVLPLFVKHECLERLQVINHRIKTTAKESLRDFIEIEMQNVLHSNVRSTRSNKKYIVHYLRTSMILDSVPLQKATKLCPDIPILVISYADNTVKARCCVPKRFRTNQFNAEKWMKESVASVFESRVFPPKGQDASLVCNMREKKVHLQEWDPLLNKSLEKATNYIEKNL